MNALDQARRETPRPSSPSWAGARARPRVALRNASTDAKNRALPRRRRRSAPRRPRSSPPTPSDIEAAKAAGMTRGAARPAAARRRSASRRWPRASTTSPPCPTRSAPCSSSWTRPNGLVISRVRVPLGVIGIIYEARPNVTADAGALCLKSGNVAILRGGSESFHSSRAIVALPAPRRCRAPACRRLRPARADPRPRRGRRDAARHRLARRHRAARRALADRAGAARRAACRCSRHLDGICHVYVDRAADLAMARDIVVNAKMRRVSVCGATETLLVDRAALDTHLLPVLAELHRARLRGARRRRRCRSSIPGAGRHREGLAHRISRRRSSRSRRSTASTARSRTSPLRLAPHRLDRHRGRGDRASASSPRSTAPSSCTTPRPSSPTAASSAWARRSASPPAGCTPRGPVGAEQLTTYKIPRARQRPGAPLSASARRDRVARREQAAVEAPASAMPEIAAPPHRAARRLVQPRP